MFDANNLNEVDVIKCNDRQSIVRMTDSEGKLYLKRIINGDKREVYKLLQKINHPSIPKIYHVDFEENTVVIEEYVEGKSLGQLMESKIEFSRKKIKKVSEQILSALGELHRMNIIHRDIKPDNILVDSQENVHLVDFDIARVFRHEVRRDTETKGTFGYAPIEQFGMMPTDFKTDIYAFGVTLSVLLDYSEIKGKLANVADKCKRLDPSLRYADVQQVQNAIGQKRTKWICTGILIALFATVISFFATDDFSNKKIPKDNVVMDKPNEETKVIEEQEERKEENVEIPIIAEDKSIILPEQKDVESVPETEVLPSAEAETETFENQFSGFGLGKFEEQVLKCSNFPYVSIFLTDEEYTHVLFLEDMQKMGKIKLGKNQDIIDAEFGLENGQLAVYLSDSKGNTFTHLFKYNERYQYEKQYTVDLQNNADIMCYDLDNDGVDELLIGLNECSLFVADGMVYNNCNYSIAWCVEYDSENGFALCSGDMFSKEGPFVINRFSNKLNVKWENSSDITGYYAQNGEIVPIF